MQGAIKDWGQLPIEEQFSKAREVGQALKDLGLLSCKVQIIQQVIAPLKSGALKIQNTLLVEGIVYGEQTDALQEFRQMFKKIIQGVNPKTAVIQLMVKRKPGENYI